MIKDKLTEAVKTGLNNIKNGDDHIPLGMRGELEVIVKDREGNVLSYERDHNQVTKLAKMAIIHLLAGEIGTIDPVLISIENTTTAGMRALMLRDSGAPVPANNAEIFTTFNPDHHTMQSNEDGHLVSEMQFFYSGSEVVDANRTSRLSQVSPYLGNDLMAFNYPTKMLFGTGSECYDEASLNTAYVDAVAGDIRLTTQTIARLNGYSSNQASTMTVDTFLTNLGFSGDVEPNMVLTNWYSNNAYRCRSLQPATTEPLSDIPNSDDTSIRGAIKNCYIMSTEDSAKYNSTTKMALPEYRGYGYPCFIYARRSTTSFYDTTQKNTETYYQKNDIFDNEPYETELTYTVVMPAQPVNSNDITTFYPYNGWVLKQAGLFCDSRYKLRSRNNDSELGEQAFIDEVSSGVESDSDDAKMYRDSVGGQMLFTRNLSSPIMKTADTEVAFIWHIFITV